MGFKAISQNVTQSKDSVVILSEKQARAAATDLVRYDFCKKVASEQERRISNLKLTVTTLEKSIVAKDSVIFYKDDIIDKQNKILNIKPKPEFHGYVGVLSDRFTLNTPFLTGKVLLETKKLNFGFQYIGLPTINNQFGVLVEYKLF